MDEKGKERTMTTEERLEKLERELSRAKRRNRWLLAGKNLTLGCTSSGVFGVHKKGRGH